VLKPLEAKWNASEEIVKRKRIGGGEGEALDPCTNFTVFAQFSKGHRHRRNNIGHVIAVFGGMKKVAYIKKNINLQDWLDL